jgi:hypothetical protein
MAIKVKDFWIKPPDPPISVKSIDFGYTRDKKVQYRAEVLDNDNQSFHSFVFLILKSKKQNLLPWPLVKSLKDKVKITNLDDKARQEELPLKIASRYLISL